MATVRSKRFETPSGRLKLPVAKKPVVAARLARGVFLLYRRNKSGGSWILKVSTGSGTYSTRGFAIADDYESANGSTVLNYWRACDRALKLARGTDGGASGEKLITVEEALDQYEEDLRANNASSYNAQRARIHLRGSTILGKPVGVLNAAELAKWRDGLLAKGLQPSTVNRTATPLKAACELARKRDPRIRNQQAWEVGLSVLPNATVARRMILPDESIARLVTSAYSLDPALGLMVETDAVIGARISQLSRITVADLQFDDRPDNPRLMVPTSRKGGRRAAKPDHTAVPIPVTLARKLKAVAGDRASDAPLLLRGDGCRWDKANHRQAFRVAVGRAGFDPDTVTSYCFRHSAIARWLLRGLSPAVVARQADTSIQELQKHYARFICDHSDAVARTAMLDVSTVPLLPTPAAIDAEGRSGEQ
jgi:integrase